MGARRELRVVIALAATVAAATTLWAAPALAAGGPIAGGTLGAALLVAPLASSPAVVSAWGDDTYGELGNGHEGEGQASKVPVHVDGVSGVVSVAAGNSFGLALLENGTVMSWGNNAVGELGDGTTTSSDVAVPVQGLSEVTAIAAGESFGLALLANGTVMAWGDNEHGQLGTGSTSGPEGCSEIFVCSTAPVPVQGLTDVTAISAKGGHSLALRSNGTVMAWGENTFGDLGNGTAERSDVPLEVQGLSEVTAVSAGQAHSLALRKNGTVMAWGVNDSGELGIGNDTGPETCAESAVPCSRRPVEVSGLSGVVSIAGGGLHSLALLSGGTVDAWGYNEDGQVGDGTHQSRFSPVPVSGLSGVSAIAAGEYHSLALLSSGSVMAWGWDSEWQLGNVNAEERSLVPVAVMGLSGATAIAGGWSFSLAASATPPGYPQVTGVEPNYGPSAGGTSVTIKGLAFNDVTSVKFGTEAAKSFTVNSETSITAVSPPGTGVVDVTVSTPEGTSYTYPGDRFFYAPIINSVEPSQGPGRGATSVRIYGLNFTGASAVKFGSENASFKVESEDEITAVSPPGAGTVNVTVTGAGGTSEQREADRFTYDTPFPFVTRVEPNRGPPYGGTSVTITGGNFTGATGVTFGSVKATSFEVVSEDSIRATSPAGAGTVNVRVTTAEGTSVEVEQDRFTYVVPSVTAVTPNRGPTSGGNAVTITGANFAEASAVKFGSANAASFEVVSEGSIRAISPAGTGAVDVTVTTPDGTSATSPADQFTYDASAPSVTGVEPRQDPSAGGNFVTITGTGFNGATAVHFGARNAESLTVASEDTITAISLPAAAPSM